MKACGRKRGGTKYKGIATLADTEVEIKNRGKVYKFIS